METNPRESESSPSPLLLTIGEAAYKLGMSEPFVHKLQRHHKITPVKMGRATRYRLEEVERLASDGVSF